MGMDLWFQDKTWRHWTSPKKCCSVRLSGDVGIGNGRNGHQSSMERLQVTRIEGGLPMQVHRKEGLHWLDEDIPYSIMEEDITGFEGSDEYLNKGASYQ